METNKAIFETHTRNSFPCCLGHFSRQAAPITLFSLAILWNHPSKSLEKKDVLVFSFGPEEDEGWVFGGERAGGGRETGWKYARKSRVDELNFDVSNTRVTIFLEVAKASTSNLATT